MNDRVSERKIEHIRIIEEDEAVDRRRHYFDAIQCRHRALPEVDLDAVDPSTTFLNKSLSFPLLISSMTGGEHEVIQTVNRNLALAAEQTGVAMGVGSQRVMFSHENARSSFELREHAPGTLLFANIGGVQLNHGFTPEHCREAVKTLEADALFLHLNPLQEAVQPEGDTRFGGLAEKIGQAANALDVPIILKEVGAGISVADAEQVIHRGIRYIDVAGSGGTSWSRIEHHRQATESENNLGLMFQDWGIPTPMALMEFKPWRDRLTLLASGGIRSGIDMAKAVILGASLCGLASPFLKPAMESADRVIEVIEKLRREFVTAMFLLGVDRFEQLFGNESLLLQNPYKK